VPALQDAEIKGAIRKVQSGSASRVTLKDGYGRGGGRLALMIRPAKNGITAEWYATQHMNGKRTLAKIGVYPQLTLADARAKFTGYSLRIREGISVKRKQATGDTFESMLKGYCASLDNERVRRQRELALLESSGCAADFIGRSRRACEVTTSEVVDWLRTFHQRGAIVQADNVRAHLSAAFNWAMGSENDYRQAHSANWNIVINPVAAIPPDPNADRAATRFLSTDEFKQLLQWLDRQTKPAAKCLHVLALTGQRIEEISALKPAQFDGKMLDWDKTKNGKPHCIPVPKQAAKILTGLPPSMFGNPSYRVVRDVIGKFCEESKVKPFTTKDLRRTWKTLAGEAGISKADRDLIQNHSKGDVSSKHYDRYEYLREKRAAMQRWSDWVDQLLVTGLKKSTG
jgi:integrase